jgi:hypothetical protein
MNSTEMKKKIFRENEKKLRLRSIKFLELFLVPNINFYVSRA